jgi:ABC-2 type transport system ATP-binding protein
VRLVNQHLPVDATGVGKSFGSVLAVDDITVRVAVGEVYGVLGPNGAGKTTFLRMLFGLIRPDAGSISVFGRTWDSAGVGVLDGVAGFIESPRFYPYLTGRQNLEGLALLDGGVRPGLLEEVLELVEMADRADQKVGGYSYGMRQRLGVAASLLREPRLLVLDEPANGLDPAGMRDMRALVKRLADSGLTVLLSSHDMAEVEQICDDVTIMRRGSVAFHGTIAELRTRAPDPGHRLVTSDDERAVTLAARHPQVSVVLDPVPADGSTPALAVTGPRAQVSAYVAALVRADVELLELTPTRTPLEALFFMLTDDPAADPADPDHLDAHREARR